MAEKCCVPGCKTKKSEKVTFFPVPVNSIMRKAWENRISGKKLADSDHVCAKHFLMKDVFVKQGGTPKLKVTATPIIPKVENKEDVSTSTNHRKIKVRKFAQEIPTPTIVKKEKPKEQQQYPLIDIQKQDDQSVTKSKKSKKKKNPKKGCTVVDPLDIKNEPNQDLINPLSGCVAYNDSTQIFSYSDMDTNDVKPKDRLAILEAENLQLKTKYSQLINDYVQMKTEKIQLKAELDAALAANQKLIIVKNSLVTTIQTLGKMSEPVRLTNGPVLPSTLQIDPSSIQHQQHTAEVSDTIIGF
ncbi:uncharacterized protein LOC123292410 [Chrysoperla carnea]|uniref:uncharacterized protein LOC123292410 n=1 Tax=Chrysoperla carnea TaxID=189513 RepID=UPI001D06871A|nr:uncharacterized protein LOC123292410 [Chrysoperla carnea]